MNVYKMNGNTIICEDDVLNAIVIIIYKEIGY